MWPATEVSPREPLVRIALGDVRPIIIPLNQRRRPLRPFRGVQIDRQRVLVLLRHRGPHIVQKRAPDAEAATVRRTVISHRRGPRARALALRLGGKCQCRFEKII
jgi:hypothetical protein